MIGMPRGRVSRGNLFEPHAAEVLPIAEQDHQRHRLGERAVELVPGVDLDDVAADHAHRLVVGKALASGDDDPVDHALGERQAQHLHGVVAGDAGGRAERHRGRAAAGDEAPLGQGQLGQAPTRRLHQLVEIDERARGRVHRPAHLRQHQAAAMQGAHAAAIDEGPHAERQIGIEISGHEASPTAIGSL